jgi:predicted signal transduction protein with EAL and GGDEF domain
MHPFHCLEQELYIKAGIGITIFNDNKDHNVDLLQQAELALYHAKASSKNTARFSQAHKSLK